MFSGSQLLHPPHALHLPAEKSVLHVHRLAGTAGI
jgi:hypothetical protein